MTVLSLIKTLSVQAFDLRIIKLFFNGYGTRTTILNLSRNNYLRFFRLSGTQIERWMGAECITELYLNTLNIHLDDKSFNRSHGIGHYISIK